MPRSEDFPKLGDYFYIPCHPCGVAHTRMQAVLIDMKEALRERKWHAGMGGRSGSDPAAPQHAGGGPSVKAPDVHEGAPPHIKGLQPQPIDGSGFTGQLGEGSEVGGFIPPPSDSIGSSRPWIDFSVRGDDMRWLQPETERAAGRGALADLMETVASLRPELQKMG